MHGSIYNFNSHCKSESHEAKTTETEKMKATYYSSILGIALFFFAAAGESHGGGDVCVYSLYVKTGSIIKAGTDSTIGVVLGDPYGRSVWIRDLELWGLMEPRHDYYERGNLDVFSGRAPCIGGPLCSLNLTSDGRGLHHGWYCDYVEVTSTGPHQDCSQTIFYVDQWLATDVPPFQLTAVLDGCRIGDGAAKQGMNGKSVVRNPRGSAAA